MSLVEAGARYCAEVIDPQRFAYREEVQWDDPGALEATASELESRIAELESVVGVCDELLGLLRELDGLTDRPAEFNRRIIRVDELRSRIERESRAYQIVNVATQQVEFRRFSADRKLSTERPDEQERAKRQIRRDIEFMTGVREGALEVTPYLTDSLNRVRDRMSST